MTSEPRRKVITFRVTDTEYIQLEQARLSSGLSNVGDYCRTSSLGSTASSDTVRVAHAHNSLAAAASTMETALAQAKALLQPEGE